MAKRGPQFELNDRNWDQEQEPEEAGVFKEATSDVIQQRIIKKAKRRLPDQDSSEPQQKPAAFGLFGGLVTSRPSLKPDLDKTPTIKFGNGTQTTSPAAPTGLVDAASPANNSAKTTPQRESGDSYMQALKALNESVLAWVKQHVEGNPYIILSPVFKDYEKHLASIEGKKSSATPSASSSSTSKNVDANSKSPANASQTAKVVEGDSSKAEALPSSKTPGFSFGSNSSSSGAGFSLPTPKSSALGSGFSFGLATTTTSSQGTAGGFSFAQNTSSSASNSNGPASFGGSSSMSTPSSGFSFGGANTSTAGFGTGFGAGFGALAANAAAASSAAKSGEDDEDYVPPKPEVKEVKESDALYTKRCKLFYKKGDSWVDRGVGNIHLKPVNETKTQILVRADTNLGNILLNIMLNDSLPMSRQGKNNVLLVCTPNPPVKEGEKDSKPVPMLIRVKTGEDADELLAKLEERKKLLSD